MFSKALTSFLLMVSLTSCSWWGGEAKDLNVIELDEAQVLGGSSECINGLSLFFSNYFRGNTNDLEIQRNFDCVGESVESLFENAKEKDTTNGFSRKEMLSILTAVFPKKEKKFLAENIEILFLIKRLFVGGVEDGFSRKDHAKIKLALIPVSKEFKKAKTDIKYVFYAKGTKFKDRDAGFKRLRLVFAELDSIKIKHKGLFNSKEGSKLIGFIFDGEDIGKYKPLARIVKTLVFGDKEKTFHESQKDFFTRLYAALEFQARLRLSSQKEGFLFGESYYDLIQSLNIFSDSILTWSTQNPNWSLKVQIFEDVIVSLHKLGFLSSMFSDPVFASSSVKKILTTIFERDELHRESLIQLNRILKGWVNRQTKLVNSYNFKWIKPENPKLGVESANILKEINDFKSPQFVSDGKSPIVIKRSLETLLPKELYFDQSLKHLIASLANEFFKAYSSFSPFTKKGSKTSLSLRLPDISRIFADIRPLGLELGFIDPHHCGSENRVFIEADSLTLSGNGDNAISITEAVEWVSTMISVSSLSNDVYAQMEETCGLPGMQVLGGQFLNRKCAMKNLMSRKSIFREHFPGAASYLEMLESDDRRKDFESKLGSIVGSLISQFYTFEQPSHESFSEKRFNSFNSCKEGDAVPFSKREFNTSLASSIYIENLFHQFDTTGLSVLVWDGWDPNWIDSKGHDFILDGKELTAFLSKKFTYKVGFLNLPETTMRIDRNRAYEFLNSLIGFRPYKEDGTKVEAYKIFSKFTTFRFKKQHRFSKNYCRDIERTSKTSVSYKKEDRRMCLSKDEAFKSNKKSK